MTDLEETLKYAEKQRERLAAIIRVFVFLALLASSIVYQVARRAPSPGSGRHDCIRHSRHWRANIFLARDIPSSAAGGICHPGGGACRRPDDPDGVAYGAIADVSIRACLSPPSSSSFSPMPRCVTGPGWSYGPPVCFISMMALAARFMPTT